VTYNSIARLDPNLRSFFEVCMIARLEPLCIDNEDPQLLLVIDFGLTPLSYGILSSDGQRGSNLVQKAEVPDSACNR